MTVEKDTPQTGVSDEKAPPKVPETNDLALNSAKAEIEKVKAELAETKMRTEIQDLALASGFTFDVARDLAAKSKNVESAAKEMLKMKIGTQARIDGALSVNDNAAKHEAAQIQAAVNLKFGLQVEDKDLQGNPFRRMNMVQIAEQSLRARGVDPSNMGDSEVLLKARMPVHGNLAQSSADFPHVLSTATNSIKAAAYESVPTNFESWSTRRDLPDFREVEWTQMSGTGLLKKRSDTASVEFSTLKDGGEKMRVYKYIDGVKLTDEALINDYLGAFSDILTNQIRSVRMTCQDIAVQSLLANANMADGVPLFHSTHKNLASAGLVTAANLGAMASMMRVQTGLKGERIYMRGAKLLLPESFGLTAEQLYAVQNYKPTDKAYAVTPGIQFEIMTDGAIDESATPYNYFLIGDSRYATGAVHGYLQSRPGAQLRQILDEKTLDTIFIVEMYFAWKIVDHRFFVKNPQASAS